MRGNIHFIILYPWFMSIILHGLTKCSLIECCMLILVYTTSTTTLLKSVCIVLYASINIYGCLGRGWPQSGSGSMNPNTSFSMCCVLDHSALELWIGTTSNGLVVITKTKNWHQFSFHTVFFLFKPQRWQKYKEIQDINIYLSLLTL